MGTAPRRLVALAAALVVVLWVPQWLAPGLGAPPTRSVPSQRPTPAEAGAGTGRMLCVLPVGDSLTRGVGRHGSYRHHLAATLRRHVAKPLLRAGPVARFGSVGFVGTERHPCVAGSPSSPFTAAVGDEPHCGHCGWGSAAIGAHLRGVLNGSLGLHPEVPAACRGPDGAPVVDAALLLAGHNDAFQVARLCKVKERCEADPPSGKAQRALRCATEHLRTGLGATLPAMGADVLRRHPGAVLVLGRHPPTGFPCLDSALRGHTDAAAVALQHEFPQGTVRVARFPGFVTGRHTFDTTHPNAAGAALMADGWLHALLGP